MKMGTYVFGRSFYHALDARAKLIFTLMFSIALIQSPSLCPAFSMMALSILLSLVSVGIKESFLNFRRIALLVAFIILFSPLQKRDGEPLLEIGSFLLLSKQGALSSALILFKFIGISFIFSLLLETERIEEVIAALRYFRVPYSISLTISMTLSFIPALINRYSEIREAVSLRLNDEGKKEGMMAILVSLIVSAIKLVPESASALEERGFTGRAVNGYRRLSMSPLIFTEIILSVIIPIAFIFWR